MFAHEEETRRQHEAFTQALAEVSTEEETVNPSLPVGAPVTYAPAEVASQLTEGEHGRSEHAQPPQGHLVWIHKALAKQCKRFVPGIFVS